MRHSDIEAKISSERKARQEAAEKDRFDKPVVIRLLLAQGEELLRLALNDLAELGDQVPGIGVRRHARRKREVRAVAGRARHE